MSTPRPISEAKNPDLRNSMAAMLRAAKMAREVAIQTNTGIVVHRNGQRVLIAADQLRAEAATENLK